MVLKFLRPYRRISDTGILKRHELLEDYDGGNPRGRHKVIWTERIERTEKRIIGMHIMVPPTLTDSEIYQHPAFAALDDLEKVEDGPFNQLGNFWLNWVAKQLPLAVHRYGLFRNYGMRDLLFIRSNGSVECWDLDYKQMMGGPGNPVFKSERKGDVEGAASWLVSKLLYESPDAYIFVHKMGAEADPNLVSQYISIVPDYKLVAEQVRNGVSVPPEHAANVRALMDVEEDIPMNPILSHLMVRGYLFETKDAAHYFLIVDGKVTGFNNWRAMKGMVEQAYLSNPIAKILVHKMSSELDFDLARKLLVINPMDGFVERRSPRTK